jgi:O-antigen/teichoic acid export membrane protein
MAAAFLTSPPPDLIDGQLPGALPGRRDLASFGSRLTFAGVAPIDGLAIDALVIGVLLTHTDLGLYAIGFAFESIPVLTLIGMASVAAPRLAAMADPVGRKAAGYRWMLGGAGLVAVVCVLVELVLQPVLVAAFGHAAGAALTVARILVLAGLFLGLRRLGAAVLQALGHPGRSTWAELIGFAVLLVAVPTLTTEFGIKGSASALLIAGLASVMAQFVLLRRPAPVRGRHAA